MTRETIFSPCRKYRYTLWREWHREARSLFEGANDGEQGSDRADQYVQFIGLNPSTADEVQDDPTIRRCIGYAKRWGFGAFCMTNIFAWRDTDPHAMKKVVDPIGEWRELDDVGPLVNDNNIWLARIAAGAGLVIAAWGTHGSHLGRGSEVTHLLRPYNVHCLGKNSDGSPKHPLYLKGDSTPIPYEPPNIERVLLEQGWKV